MASNLKSFCRPRRKQMVMTHNVLRRGVQAGSYIETLVHPSFLLTQLSLWFSRMENQTIYVILK